MENSAKKLIALFLIIAMVLSFGSTIGANPSVDSKIVTTDAWTGADGYLTIDKETVTLNSTGRNNFFLSPDKYTSFIIEADVKFDASLTTASPPAVGFAFGVTDPDIPNKAPTGWPNSFSALHVLFNSNNNATYPTANVFKAGGATFGSQPIETYVNNQNNRLKLVMNGNEATVYVNGDLLYTTTVTGYTGGQIGLCTYNKQATFSNVSIVDMSADYAAATNWVVNDQIYAKGKYTIGADKSISLDYINNWNNFLVNTDIEATDSFIFESDITASLNDLTGCGFMLSTNVSNIESGIWASDHLAVKIEHDTSEVRIHGSAAPFDKFFPLPDDFDPAAKNNLKVIVDKANVKVYVNGDLITDFEAPSLLTRTHKNIGLNSYDTKAVYSNIKYIPLERKHITESWYGCEGKYTLSAATEDKISLKNKSGNHFVMSDMKLHSFTMEADMVSSNNAGFVFGAKTSNYASLGNNWYAVHLAPTYVRVFNEANWNKPGGLNVKASLSGINLSSVNHLKLEVVGYRIKVYVNGTLYINVLCPSYTGGYIGVSNYSATTTFTNMYVTSNDNRFNTNLSDFVFSGVGKNWAETEDGYHGNNASVGDSYAFSGQYIDPDDSFVFVTNAKITTGVAGIVIAPNRTSPSSNWLCFNIDSRYSPHQSRIFAIRSGKTTDFYPRTNFTGAVTNDYYLRIVYDDYTFSYYLNDTLIKTFTDTEFTGGYIGLMTYVGDIMYNNTYCFVGDSANLKSLTVEGVELNQTFDPEIDVYMATVDYSVSSVKVKAEGDTGTVVTIGGTEANEKTVDVGVGYTNIAISVFNPDLMLTKNYSIIVRRPADPDTVYTEENRAQLHYSPQIYNLNDPNGLCYNAYRDEYHLYYQYNPYFLGFGNKAWGHAVSKDLVNWEERPVAIFPDEKGAKWSGSAVIDRNNTSGLFDETTHPDDRMVFAISNWLPEGGSRLQIAYSTDGGETVKYYNDGEFLLNVQDMKIIWHEESQKWLMLPTNGNIYYSSNLINWTSGGRTYQKNGSAFPGWECQDFYPLEVDGDPDNVKWVLNAAGSWYAVGRLEWSEGKYNFYAETDVQLYNGESNQEKDKTLANGYFFEQSGDKSLYATQSFFNDKLGRRITIGWVQEIQGAENTWQCHETLAYEQTLKATADGGYKLYSYPVEEFDGNRLNPIYHAEDLTVGENTENILGNTNALIYDVEAEVTLGADTTEVGFTLRDNGTNYLKVYYDAANKQLVVDKTQSGSSYVGQYGNPTMPMSVLDGNKIKFRLVVDNAVLEVFGNDGEAPIVSMANPLQNGGMSFYVKGDHVTVNDMTVYSMQSIWFDKPADGDLNGDGNVDICDLVKQNLYENDKNVEVKNSCDYNKDKKIDGKDAASLRKLIIGTIINLLF